MPDEQSGAAALWTGKRLWYTSQLRKYLLEDPPVCSIRVFQPLKVQYDTEIGPFIRDNSRMLEAFEGVEIAVQSKQEWARLVHAFSDPVLTYLESQNASATRNEEKLRNLKLEEKQCTGNGSVNAMQLRTCVQHLEADVAKQREEALGFDSGFIVNDASEIRRRLRLYESAPMWDALAVAVEERAVAVYKYEYATAQVKELGTDSSTENSKVKLELEAQQTLIEKCRKEARVNSLLEHNSFFACAEIAAKKMRIKLHELENTYGRPAETGETLARPMPVAAPVDLPKAAALLAAPSVIRDALCNRIARLTR